MKLYSSPLSPFGTRITIALRAKGLELDSAPLPAAGIKSPEYLAINPVGRIPVLVTDSGVVIPESATILDYLEDRFPKPALRHADPDQQARVNVAIRMMDTYVMTPVIRLFLQLDPARRDQKIVAQELQLWRSGLAALAHFMRTPLPQPATGLSLADCALPPSLHLSARIAMMLELPDDLLQPHQALSSYYARIRQHPIVGPALAALTLAQAEKDVKAGRPSLASRQ